MRSRWSGSVGALLFATACGGADSRAPAGTVEGIVSPLVGGDVDERTTAVVSISLDAKTSFSADCSGTLIAPNLVLTARHCVAVTSAPDEQVSCDATQFVGVAPADLFVVSASTARPEARTDPSLVRVAQVRVAGTTPDVCGHDIALLVLAESIPRAVAAPLVPRVDSNAAAAEIFSAVGYGYTDPKKMSGDGTRMRLDERTVRCLGGDCSTQSDVLREGEWLSVDAPLCPGDSGSPAIDGRGKVFGVASRAGAGCSRAIYSDVAAFRDVIVQAGLDATRAGDYAAPGWTSGISSLGAACSGGCPDGLACYSESGAPPGECVPRCDSDAACPSGLVCAKDVSVCTRAPSPRASSGCHFAARAFSRGEGGGAVAIAGALVLLLRRPRRPGK